MATRLRRRTRPTVAAEDGKMVVTTVFKFEDGQTQTTTDTHEVFIRQFESDPAYVRVSMGMTKNLGNFESLRTDVSISMPCYPAEVEQVYEEIASKVSALLAEEIEAQTK